MRACLNACGVEMSGAAVPSRMTTPVRVRPRSTIVAGMTMPRLANSAIADSDSITRSATSPFLIRSRSEPAVPKFKLSFFPLSRSNSAPSAVIIDFTAPALITLISDAKPSSSLRARLAAKRSRLGVKAFDHRAAADELVFKPLEAAIEVVDAVHHCLAFGGQGRDNQ